MKTTADTWNRIRDKKRIENSLGILEEGNNNQFFYSPKGTILAIGYTRIVYGDHGPYLEFLESHICSAYWKLTKQKGSYSWYDEARPRDGSNILLYIQKRDVKMLHNPPAGKYSVRNNRRDGYADYKVGMYYISPDQILTTPPQIANILF